MSARQNLTTTKKAAEVTKESVGDWRHEAWIDYRALNGLITDDDGIRKMTVDEFATWVGVATRQTLYDWQKSIPDFWQRVNDRRVEIAPRARLQRIHETWYLKAAQVNNWPVTEAWLRNFDPNFKEARTKVEHDVAGSLLDVLEKARTRSVIEGEVVLDAGDQTTNA